MLQAKTKQGKWIIPSQHTMADVLYWKANEQFVCPTCHGPVILKAGTKTIPHFAHQSKQDCPIQEGGEGVYHEKGKLLLFEWLVRQGLQVSLERYLPSIKQRPDIFLVIQQKQIAIEYQCARISQKEILKRNLGYRKAQITPIWIVGYKHLKQMDAHHLKVDQFLQQFIHRFNHHHPSTLYFFSPEASCFTIVQDIYLTSAQRAIGVFTKLHLRDMVFLHLFQTKFMNKQQLYTLWLREKQKFRLRPRNGKGKRAYQFYQWLYLHHMQIDYLASVIHLPVCSQYLMKLPVWEWQARLCVDYLHKIPLHGKISIKRCYDICKFQERDLQNYPLISTKDNPIMEYLQLLSDIELLQQYMPMQFIKVKQFHFYQHIETSLKGDEQLIHTLMTNDSNKIRA